MNTTTCSVFVLLIGTLIGSAAPMDEAQALIHDIRMLASVTDYSANDRPRQIVAQATMAMERIMSLARDHEDVASLLVAELTNAPVHTSSARRIGVVQAHGATQQIFRTVFYVNCLIRIIYVIFSLLLCTLIIYL